MLKLFFPADILDRARVAQNIQPESPPPAMLEPVKSFALPPLVHQPSIAFGDVIIFQGKVKERSLFHSLVHVVQYDLLGTEAILNCFCAPWFARGLH